MAATIIEGNSSTHRIIDTKKHKHKVTSPLEKKDHLELDNYDYLDCNGVVMYSFMIGLLQ